MGPFVKKAALSGLLAMSTGAACHAQTAWQWPSSASAAGGTPPPKAVSWQEINALAPQPGLIGNSDLNSSAPAPSQIRAAASQSAFQWDRPGTVATPEGPPEHSSSRRSTQPPSTPESAITRAPTAPQIIGPVGSNAYAGPGLIGPSDASSRLPARVAAPPASTAGLGSAKPNGQPAPNRQPLASNHQDAAAQSVATSPRGGIPHPTPPTSTPTSIPATSIPATSIPATSIPATSIPPTSSKTYQLQTLVKAEKHEAAAVPSQPAASASDTAGPTSYVLQDLRPEGSTESTQPIDIIPFSRLTSQSMQVSSGPYSAAAMMGPLTDPSILFSQLDIKEDFRHLPTEIPGTVRTDYDVSGYGPEWMYTNYVWVTPTFYYQPLYFEQPNLERYGIGPKRHWQPLASSAHFFTCVSLMPYKLLVEPPCERVYPLGHQRPGDCVRFQKRTLLGQATLR